MNTATNKNKDKGQKDWWGMDEGKGWIAPDFDETPQEMLDSIEASIFPDEHDTKDDQA